MPKNKSEDLNNLLFETMEKMRDGDMDIDRGMAIAQVAQVIVNNQKNEIAYLDIVGGLGTGSGFFTPRKDEKLLGE